MLKKYQGPIFLPEPIPRCIQCIVSILHFHVQPYRLYLSCLRLPWRRHLLETAFVLPNSLRKGTYFSILNPLNNHASTSLTLLYDRLEISKEHRYTAEHGTS